MAVFVDTHTHLYLHEFDADRDDVIRQALQKDVKYMFIPNIDKQSYRAMLDLCTAFPLNCFPMSGVHPESVKEDFETELAAVAESFKTNTFYAIGECGLDYYWDETFKEQQQQVFEWHVRLAKEKDLPLVIHVRKSSEDTLEIIRKNHSNSLSGIFHCFSGNFEYGMKIIDMGFYLGIGGVVTFKNSKLAEVVRQLPLDKMVLETDSPFLAPMPYRGKRNESSYIPAIAEFVAGLKNVSVEEVAELTTANAAAVFKINLT